MIAHATSGALDFHRRRPALAFLFALSLWASVVSAQSTTFTYQGQLTEGDTGANGSYDLQFALFDTAAAGTQIGATQTVSAVAVSNGLFTVLLDFGVNAFPGANRFLEIGVRPVGVGSFTTLVPRQQISSAPYAIRTLSAATADALSSTCTGCVQDTQIQSVAGSKVNGTIPVASVPAGSGNYIQNRTTQQPTSNFNISGNGVIDGNLSVNDLSVNDLTVAGTLTANVGGASFIQNRTSQQPNANFNINGNGTVSGILSAGSLGIGMTSPGARVDIQASNNSNVLFGRRTGGGLAHNLFIDSAGNGSMQFLDAGAVPRINLGSGNTTYFNFGNVGIGTTTPQSKLDVRGDVKLGATGQLFAPGGQENLRIVRGIVGADGSLRAGSGFQPSRTDPFGNYLVTFATPFAATPAVTAAADGMTAFVVVFSVSPGQCRFSVRRDTGADVNLDFHFIAIGPR